VGRKANLRVVSEQVGNHRVEQEGRRQYRIDDNSNRGRRTLQNGQKSRRIRPEEGQVKATDLGDYNPIFEKIFARAQDGDLVIAYIAYGIYKERKREFLIERKGATGAPVPQSEIDIFHATWNDGQIDLAWRRAEETLATFAVSYADEEKKEAVRSALKEAIRGKFWKDVWVSAIANLFFAIGTIALYLLLKFMGFDLVEKLAKLSHILQ
jgi:hypothetical protein